MKTLKLLLVMMLISLQVSATGYSHNMFVAQKMLKAKKEVRKSAPKVQEPSQVQASVVTNRAAVVKAAPPAHHTPSDQGEEVKISDLTPVAFTQHLARWIVGFVCSEERNGDEKASSHDSGHSLSSHLVSLVERVIYTLV